MCTLACWLSVFEEAPLVVAANRDERLARASSGPLVRAGSPRLVAPRDEVAGGTWWAVAETGLFVALTNRAGAQLDADRRSRGLLVEEVAAQGALEQARVLVESLRAADYNGFHLFASDGREALRVVADGVRLRVEELGPGLHLLTERSFGAMPRNRAAFVREHLAPLADAPLDFEKLGRLMASHNEGEPFDGLCVHLPEHGYGTRSSALIALGGSDPKLWWAGDRPCQTPYEDRSELLRTLGLPSLTT